MTLSTMSVSASTGVMNSLLGKLTTLMGDEYRTLKGVRNKVVSLHEEFSSMNALLVKLSGMEELDVQAKVWRDQVRDMSYDIEDYIDDFMHDLEVKGATTGFLKKTAERLKKLNVRQQIANKIKVIEARVVGVHEQRVMYKLDEYSPTSSAVHIDPQALATSGDAAGLVGFDTPRDELVELLMDQGQDLKLSFGNLPDHLKTCLLYLGMYPEDQKIGRVDLLRQWIAEGFIDGTPGLDAEDIAISYFNELISRGMIQPVYTDYVNGEVWVCRVNDILLDVIRSKIEEDNFISVINDPKVVLGMHKNIRKASLQCDDKECRVTSAMVHGSLSKVRSVYVIGGFSCQSLMLLKYVRVLHLDISTNVVLDLAGISRLFLLRYLKVVGGLTVELPSQIGQLQQLETLDLGYSISMLPCDIASLPLLLHLIVEKVSVFPDGIGRLRLVRTVKVFDLKNSVENIEGLGEMTSLRDFVFRWTGNDLVEGARRMDVLRSSLERISSSLKILKMDPCWERGDLDGWSTFSPPPIHLQEMWMPGCVFPTIPKWFGHLRDLQSLFFKVKGGGLKDDGVAILAGLPSLVYLRLLAEEPREERVHIPGSGMAFRALKVFHLFCEHPLLTFEAGAMPMLEKLYLDLSPRCRESSGSVEGPLVDGIEHLPAGIQEIHLYIGDKDEAVKSSLKIAFEEHHPGAALNFW